MTYLTWKPASLRTAHVCCVILGFSTTTSIIVQTKPIFEKCHERDVPYPRHCKVLLLVEPWLVVWLVFYTDHACHSHPPHALHMMHHTKSKLTQSAWVGHPQVNFTSTIFPLGWKGHYFKLIRFLANKYRLHLSHYTITCFDF